MNTVRAGGATLTCWLAYCRFLARYHRYQVEGLENLDLPRSALVAGYHGTPFAYDMFILSQVLYDRLGYLPHGIFHRVFDEVGPLRRVLDGLGGVTRDSDRLREVVNRGEHIVVLPGGSREGARSFGDRYRVDWGNHTGYVRLAARYRMPIVPVACAGVDSAYIGLFNGYRLSKRLPLPGGMPLWTGIGLGGLWPAALPLPVRFHQIVGEPIWDTAKKQLDVDDRGKMQEIHRKAVGAVAALLAQARASLRKD